ncbi:MAG: anaerobic ribonucleoside-triphosphate reductase activating protein [Oscillospiraceae bacterium]|nr:anaerobic ribonucleoside-triphosphate reductase activating protein [Oscillospiraceae bacterium]
MRIAGLVQDSIVDGPGLRFVVFAQGCQFRCEGCHNPDTWDSNGGTEVSVEDLIKDMLSNPLTDGLTLSGGEPFEQAADCISLAAAARDNGLNVWIFTGKTFEELQEESKDNYSIAKLMKLTNVLIDGKFIFAQRTLSQKWCGSKNQRVLDVPKSLKTGKGVRYE